MSKIVEERVVKMEFDNSNFEKNVKSSVLSIDNLRNSLSNLKSLNFSNLKNSLSGTTSEINNVNESTNILSKSWKAFKDTVAIAGLQEMYRLATSVRRVVESLTFDNVLSGYSKMKDTVNSTATLISQGYELEEVNKQLQRLLWFTDETSYNFTDMVSNISKFTASGKSLEDSVTAMEGIATWAALSGQNATTASRAMYQLSQAMGSYVKRQDWMSIQTANMDTTEFRKTAMETAVEMGKLKKVSKDTFAYTKSTSKGLTQVKFKVSNFVESLSEGQWLTSDVLIKTLKKYGEAADKIQDAQSAFEDFSGKYLTASEMLAIAKSNIGAKGSENWDDLIKKLELSTEESDKLKELTKNITEFSLKALEAGQEARSFSDAINATKDAVSTKWMLIFQDIFGNYNQQKKLWTDLANDLYNIFAEPYEYVLEILDLWHDKGGYDNLWSGFSNIFKSFMEILGAFRKGIREALGLDTEEGIENIADHFINITKIFSDLTKKLMPSKEILDLITTSTKFLLTVLKDIFKVAKEILDGPGKLIIKVLSSLISNITLLIKKIKLNEYIIKIIDKLNKIINSFVSNIEKATKKIKKFLDESKIIKTLATTLTNVLQNVKNIILIVIDALKAFTKTTSGALNESLTVIDLATIITTMNSVKNFIKNLEDTLFGEGDGILDSLQKLFEGITSTLNKFSKTLDVTNLVMATLIIIGLSVALFQLSKIEVKKIIPSLLALSVIIKLLPGLFSSLDKSMKSLSKMKFGNILKRMMYIRSLVISLLILSLSIKLLSTISWKKMKPALVAFATIIGIFLGLIEILGHTKINQKSLSSIKYLNKISIAMLPMAISIKILSTITWDKMIPALASLVVVLGSFVGAIEILGHSKIKSSATKNVKLINKLAFSMIGVGIAMLALSKSISIISNIEPERLKSGMIGFCTALIAMSVSLYAVSKSTKSISSIKSAIALSLAMSVGIFTIALAFLRLKDLDWKQMLVSLAGFAGVMLAAALAMRIMAKSSKQVKGGFSIDKNGIKKDPSKASSTGAAGSLVGAAISIYIIAKAFEMLANFNWKTMLTAAGSITSMLLVYAGIAKLLSGIQTKTGNNKALLEISAGILIFAISMKKLSSAIANISDLNLNFLDFAKGIGFLVVGLTPLLGLTKLMAPFAKELLIVSSAIFVYALAMNLMNAASIEAAANASLMQATAVAVAEAEWTKFEVKWKKLIAFLPNIFKLVKEAIVSFIKSIPDIIKETSSAVGAIIEAVIPILYKYLPKLIDVVIDMLVVLIDSLTKKVPDLFSSIVKLLKAIVEQIKIALNSKDAQELIKTAGMFALFLAGMAAFKFLGQSAMVGLLYFAACIAEFTLILLALSSFEDYLPTVKKGGNVLIELGDIIGKFLGNIIGGALESISNHLPNIGIQLSKFMNNLQPFIEGCKNMPDGIGSRLLGLSAGIIALGAAEFIDTLNKIASFGLNSFGNLGKEVSEFLINAMPGLKGISSVSTNVIDSVGSFVGSIGLLSKIDYKDFKKISNDISGLGTNITDFVASIATLTEHDISQTSIACDILKKIVEVADILPNTGGLAGLFAGNNDIGDFGSQLTNLGTNILTFVSGLKGEKGNIELTEHDVSQTSMACDILKKMIEVADIIPNSGGLAGLFAGNNDIGDFGEQLSNLGTNISKFSESIKDLSINDTNINKAVLIITNLKDVGKVDLSNFNSCVEDLEDSLPDFIKSISKLKEASITKAIENLNRISDLLVNLANNKVDGIQKVLTSIKEIGVNFINKFVSGLKSDDSINEIKSSANAMITVAVNELKSNTNLKSIKNAGKFFVEGFSLGIDENRSNVKNSATNLGKEALKAAKKSLEEKSPSKATYKMGKYFVEGLSNGIYENTSVVIDSSKKLGTATIESLGKTFNNINDILNMNELSDPVIKPVLDLTDIKNGAKNINGMFNNPMIARNISTISRDMNIRNQNGSNNDIIEAINKLGNNVSNSNTYNINGITYDDGSNISNAVSTLIHAVNIERRI